jgi:S-adenosylmethionine hydrolase
LDLGQGKITNKTAVGKINYIDRFGNLITNINGIKLLEFLNFNEKITVLSKNKKQEALFVQSYGLVNKGELLVTIGSSNLLEISINQGNAAQDFGINLDEEIKLIYI